MVSNRLLLVSAVALPLLAGSLEHGQVLVTTMLHELYAAGAALIPCGSGFASTLHPYE